MSSTHLLLFSYIICIILRIMIKELCASFKYRSSERATNVIKNAKERRPPKGTTTARDSG